MATKPSRGRKATLVAIKKRLRAGGLTKADINTLSKIVNRAELATAELRAGMIE